MELTLTSKHELLGSGYFIGVDNENISEQLIINIEPEELLDKWAYIEFQVNEGNKYNTPRLDIVDRQIIYDLPNGLLEKGYVKIQAIFRDDTNFLWKSFEKKFHVSNAINACQNLPEEYPDFITEAQKLLDEVSIDAAKIDKVIETEAARVETENIRVSNENTRIANENNRSNAEQTRSTAEAERISNEQTRQSNELARVTAETERETKFNTWEGTLGVLDNLSNALKNTASGEVIRVDDVSPVEHNAKVKVQSKNLIPYPYKDTTKILNGITFTDNGDGTITANGTATENAIFYSHNWSKKSLSKGIYTLSGVPDGATYSTFGVQLALRKNNTNILDKRFIGSTTFTITEDADELYMMIIVHKDTTVSNLILKPQLELGDTATEYTPYVDPTSVTVTRCGKNLLPPHEKSKQYGYTVTKNSDGSVLVTGASTTDEAIYLNLSPINEMPIVLKKGGKYTLSCKSTNGREMMIKATDGKGNIKWLKENEFSTLIGTDYVNLVQFYVQIGTNTYIDANAVGDTSLCGTYYFQLEVGENVTDFETYNKGETYTPNADGSLTIASTTPTMTLLTDKDVNIDLEYNQDINKVIKSLQDKINALTK